MNNKCHKLFNVFLTEPGVDEYSNIISPVSVRRSHIKSRPKNAKSQL